jgi:hypothetical protein
MILKDKNGRELNSDLALWFDPQSIRDHFDSCDKNLAEGMTEEELLDVAAECLNSDSLYELFHELLVEAVAAVKADDSCTN